MEEQQNEFPLQRNFKCLKIVWEIENSFCVTYEKKWEIRSPLFTVHYSVPQKWRFVLTDSEDDGDAECVASLHLLRQETSDITHPLHVSWKLSIESIIISNEEAKSCDHQKISAKIKNYKLQEKLKNISVRKFNIEAIFLVTSLEDRAVYGGTNDAGLRLLSENIGDLFISKRCCDLTVNTGKESLMGHKSILSARNKLLNDIIVHNNATKEVSVAYTDKETAENIFRYLYSGNLDYVLKTPSVSMHEAIHFFKIKELEKYYMNDEFNLRTKFEAKGYYYTWIITDIPTDRNVSLFSPIFGDRNLNIMLQLRLLLELQDVDTNGRIGIFLDGSFPREWKELFIVFEIVDKYSHQTNLKKAVRWSREHGGPPGIEDFFSRDTFNKIYTAGNNSLTISSSVFIPNYSVPSSLFLLNVRKCLPTYINPEEHYTLFSKRIESLLDSGKYSDLTIKCENKHFLVHKCILTARLEYLTNGLKLPENQKVVFLGGADTATLEIILRYVYSGVLEFDGVFDFYKICKTAEKLGLFILKHQCTQLLRANQVPKVFDTLFEAHVKKHVEVKSAVFKFLMDNRREIRDQSMWEKLMNEEDLYEEFKEYLITQVRNNPEAGLLLDEI